ncbi:MAG: aminotransferase [Devosiaceae bacterium]|nr:aminotransferase [Devosiaceae bacterium MH13]
MRSTHPLYTGMPTTIFEVMSRLAMEHKAVNLGQGFPDVDGPQEVREVAAKALLDGPNQYPPMLGLPALREAVATAEQRFFGLLTNPDQVVITSGATEALSDGLMALAEPGDEVVVFDPSYDCYVPLIERAGGTARLVSLNPPDWSFSDESLDAAFGPRTKAILLNNPLNPASKVFSRAELERIAQRVRTHDTFVISDEVYEHLVFDGLNHVPFSALPGMAERTVRIGSAGKTFSLTGWKVGMITGPDHLIAPIGKAHQFTTFTTPPNLQTAVAFGLGLPDSYFAGLANDLAAKRDRLAAGLQRAGLPTLPAHGSYFLIADIASLGLGDDVEVAQRMTVEAGVTTVPMSAFYKGDAPRNLLRFCFCKRDEVLDEALERLQAWQARGFKAAA